MVICEDGFFELCGLSNGVYWVMVNKSGFVIGFVDDVRFDGSDVFSVEIELGIGFVFIGMISGFDFDQFLIVQIFVFQVGGNVGWFVIGKVIYEGDYCFESLSVGNWVVMVLVGDSGCMLCEFVIIDFGVLEMVFDFEFGGGLMLIGQIVGKSGF